MEKSSTEKLKSSRLMSKRMKWIITAIVVAVLVALAFSVVFIRLKTQSKTSSSAPDISSTVPRDSHAKEVDVVSLVGFHVGRMIANRRATESSHRLSVTVQGACRTQRITGSLRLHSDWLYHGNARKRHRRRLLNGGRHVQF